jgi:hypothetical protein
MKKLRADSAKNLWKTVDSSQTCPPKLLKTYHSAGPGELTESDSTLYNSSTDDLNRVTIAVPKAKRGQSTEAAKRRSARQSKLNSSFDGATRLKMQVVADDSKLVRRSGCEISGTFFVLSIYELDTNSLLVEA